MSQIPKPLQDLQSKYPISIEVSLVDFRIKLNKFIDKNEYKQLLKELSGIRNFKFVRESSKVFVLVNHDPMLIAKILINKTRDLNNYFNSLLMILKSRRLLSGKPVDEIEEENMKTIIPTTKGKLVIVVDVTNDEIVNIEIK